MVTYNEIKNIEDLKRRGQFFKEGQVIPQRVLKCNKRKHAHRKVFGSDSWVMPVNGSYLVAVFCGEFGAAIRLLPDTKNGMHAKNCMFDGSPYGYKGTFWIGNYQLSDEEFVRELNFTLQKLTKTD